VDRLWPYANEWFESDDVDAHCAAQGLAPSAQSLQAPWLASVDAVLARAALAMPRYAGHQRGGKRGAHTEHLGRLLCEMQFVQRAYPGAKW